MTSSDFLASLSCNMSLKTLGTICHDTPNLSFNQPHCSFSPPSESFSHKSSSSSCVSQLTKNDMAGENLKTGPPFNAMNCCPSSFKRHGHYRSLESSGGRCRRFSVMGDIYDF